MPSTVTLAHTTAAMGTSTAAVLAASSDRKYALIINDSDTVVYLKLGAAAVANEGIRLTASGGSFEMSPQIGNLDQRAINGIIGSGSGKVVVVSQGT
jgi:hypothetical protein